MALGTIQAIVRGRWRLSTPLLALALYSVGVVGCADRGEIRSEMARLRADLTAHNAAMASLTERVQAIERQVVPPASGAVYTAHEWQQAIEVLLKKALEVDVRLSQLEVMKTAAPPPEKPRPSTPKPAIEAPRYTGERRKEISLGMVQEEVRRIFGDPLRTEYAGDYIFWHYSSVNNQKYVVFERDGGRVSGWSGL